MPRTLANGRYEVRGILGEGGMAKVYSCWDTMLHVERAAKILNPALMRSNKVRERFLNEARTMAQLQHPNIVQVVDVGMDGNEAFMVMELMTGGTLQDLVNTHGPLAPHKACRLILSVLAGLATAHKAGVIHRDIKPQNILLDESGRPKVTDFGIAHFETAQKQMTRTGAVLGTMGFMAPEQRISARKVDGRADLYAVATTLYAALTAQMPIELYASELDEELLRGIPIPIRPVIQKATRYKPEDRFTNAAAMAEAVRDAMVQVPEGTGPAPLPDLPSEGSETIDPGKMGLGQIGVAAEVAEERRFPAPPPPTGLQGVAPVGGTLLPSLLPEVTDVPVPRDRTDPGPALPSIPSAEALQLQLYEARLATSRRTTALAGMLVVLLLVAGAWWASRLAPSEPVVPAAVEPAPEEQVPESPGEADPPPEEAAPAEVAKPTKAKKPKKPKPPKKTEKTEKTEKAKSSGTKVSVAGAAKFVQLRTSGALYDLPANVPPGKYDIWANFGDGQGNARRGAILVGKKAVTVTCEAGFNICE